MADKKESLNIKNPKNNGVSFKGGKFSWKLFGILKFSLGVCLAPFVYSTTAAFLNESRSIAKAITDYFFYGIIAFLVLYLFIYEPVKLYNRGQKILEVVFRFFTPLIRIAPFLFPIYTILLVCVYFIWALFDKSNSALRYFAFLFGFSIALHFVFSAKILRGKGGDFLKSNYIFGFSFLYIVNISLLALVFNLMFKTYSFVNFCNYSFGVAKGIFSVVLRQLFLG
ncbi:MAG: hypothetical protein JW788_06180 [Candidatus Omnitrophica bacterium]|nr:hypothetical protein [Candidatus Omnitrophota bacterium]